MPMEPQEKRVVTDLISKVLSVYKSLGMNSENALCSARLFAVQLYSNRYSTVTEEGIWFLHCPAEIANEEAKLTDSRLEFLIEYGVVKHELDLKEEEHDRVFYSFYRYV